MSVHVGGGALQRLNLEITDAAEPHPGKKSKGQHEGELGRGVLCGEIQNCIAIGLRDWQQPIFKRLAWALMNHTGFRGGLNS